MSNTTPLLRSAPTDADRAAFLRAMLPIYWLRPETAAVLTLRSDAMTKAGLDHFDGPVIDLACGDGIFLFSHLGGRFDPGFDVHVLDPGDRARGDLYDRAPATYMPTVLQKPRQRIDQGLDLRSNLLERAGRLGLYEDMDEADLTQPLELDDESAQTMLCFGAINHFSTDQPFLSECLRVLEPGGRLILVVQAPNMIQLYQTLEGHVPDPWLARFERGMRGIWPMMYSWQQWRDRFTAAGFEVEEIAPIGSNQFSVMWNVGLRPLAGPMTRMKELARERDPDQLADIKAEWVETLALLLDPLLVTGSDLEDTTELLYVLRAPGG